MMTLHHTERKENITTTDTRSKRVTKRGAQRMSPSYPDKVPPGKLLQTPISRAFASCLPRLKKRKSNVGKRSRDQLAATVNGHRIVRSVRGCYRFRNTGSTNIAALKTMQIVAA